MSRTAAAKALSRSYAGERTLTFLVGLLAFLGGALALAVGSGGLGEFRGRRPLLDPIALDWLGGHATPARIAAIVLGVLLFVLGLRWALRSLRPEPRPDLDLDRTEGAELVVTATAIAGAVQADAEQLSTLAGVKKWIQSAQIPADGFFRAVSNLTLGEVKKDERLRTAFEKVLDEPGALEALQQPVLKPLLDEAAS